MSDSAGGAAAPVDTSALSSSAPIETVAAPPTPISDAPPAGAKEAPIEPKEQPRTTREALKAAAAKVEKDNAAPLVDDKGAVKDGDAKPAAKRDDATGKFAPKEPAKAAVADPAAAAAKPAVDPAAAAAPAKTTAPAPARFSNDAKAVWDTAPEPVKAEVARMERELTQGIEKHRARPSATAKDRAVSRDGRQVWHRRHTALTKYTNMETLLRTEPAAGPRGGLRQYRRVIARRRPDRARPGSGQGCSRNLTRPSAN
jgi:hypothetical protein